VAYAFKTIITDLSMSSLSTRSSQNIQNSVAIKRLSGFWQSFEKIDFFHCSQPTIKQGFS